MARVPQVTITIDQLRDVGACEPELDEIAERYGQSRTFRKPETLARALITCNKTKWFARHMLSDQTEFDRQHGLTWAELARQCELTWAKLALIRDEYLHQHAPLVARIYFEQEAK